MNLPRLLTMMLLSSVAGMLFTGHHTAAAAVKKAISPEEALRLAFEVTGGGLTERFKFQSKLGVRKYFLTINEQNKQYVMEIDAVSGTIMKNEMSNLPAGIVSPRPKIGAAAALKLARAILPEGTVVKCKFMTSRIAGEVYNVIIMNGERRDDFYLDAYSGELKKHTTGTVEKFFIELAAGMVTPEEARKIALQQVDGIVVKCKLYPEKKHAVDAYKVDIIKDDIRYSYKVSALIGDIIETNINYLYNRE